MAKKQTNQQVNVSQQLKQFKKNIGEDVPEEEPIKKEYFKKKEVVTAVEQVLDTNDVIKTVDTEIESNFVKMAQHDVIRLVHNIPTIQTLLKIQIVQMILDGWGKDDIIEKLNQIQTFDLARIDTIKANL